MHGNVYEWCQDVYKGDLGSKPLTDPVNNETKEIRVIRGGSWDSGGWSCRSASRLYRSVCLPGYWGIGFRLSLAINL